MTIGKRENVREENAGVGTTERFLHHCDFVIFGDVYWVLHSFYSIKIMYIVLCGCHRHSTQYFRKFHRGNVVKIQKVHLGICYVMHEYRVTKFKYKALTLIFVANNEFMIVKHMAFEFLESSSSI